jgi:ribosomal protein S18 acetylase RimI-like enzyme
VSGLEGVTHDARAVWRIEPVPGDVDAVRHLVARLGVFSAAEVSIAAELVEERLRAGLASGYHFVFADGKDGLAGYTCFGPIPATTASFDLYWIGIRAELRGRGLGTRLLAESERHIVLQGGRRVYVDTSGRAEYAPAHALYTRAGYREAARLEDFYAPGDAKLIFEKELDDAGFDPGRSALTRGRAAEQGTRASSHGRFGAEETRR